MGALEELEARFNALDPHAQAQVLAAAAKLPAAQSPWVPNEGPQTDAYFCEADELFYGGQAGGGKTDLLIGLALTAHQRSLVLRRTNKEAKKLVERFAEVIGHRNGLNGQDGVWRLDGRLIDMGGCEHEDDKQKYKGSPHDLIAFDEIPDFTESQFTFITGWNRSSDKGQRCRVVAAGNPPTTPEGQWVVEYWAPWLDPTHPNPAKPGEIRWFLGGREVDGPGPHRFEGKMVRARSRTFIPAALDDNPDLAETNYDSVLANMPEGLRRAYRDGDFTVGLQDDLWQVIPTLWVKAAQARWTPDPPRGVPMCAIAADVAQGGPDETVLSPRYDGYYAALIKKPGTETPSGSSVAGLVVTHRRDQCVVVIDMGGGYGGAAFERLAEAIGFQSLIAYKGAEKSHKRTRDKKLGFKNKRSEAIWKFREALDPDQDGGSPIALPPDPRLVADLCAPRYRETPNGIEVESKEDVCSRLGRSTDAGDAVVMSWSAGAQVSPVLRAGLYRADQRTTGRSGAMVVNMGPRRR
jgi:hypothetical protein